MQSHYLWFSLLQELDIDHTPELPQSVDPSVLSCDQLRLAVVQAVKGFKNWHQKGGPSYARKVVIPKSVFDPKDEKQSRSPKLGLTTPLSSITRSRKPDRISVVKVKLVPGRRFIILHRDIGVLECWEIEKQTKFATYSPFPEVLSLPMKKNDFFRPVSLDFEVDLDEKNSNVVIFTRATYFRQLQNGETQQRLSFF